jgi:N-acetylglucosaminyl-diphospho-decaprenol L-rhamnosyltransferase
VRAAVAVVAPGHDPKRYWRHVTATLAPSRGEGLREAAHEFNRGGPTL